MDNINDLFEQLNILRKKHKQDMTQSVKQSSDYIMNMDFASLYPSTMTMVFPNKDKKISKINKILDNINDNKRI